MSPETEKRVEKACSEHAAVPASDALEMLKELHKLRKELRRANAKVGFLELCLRVGDLPPCRNCGRIVLAGRCCDQPDIPSKS